MTDPELGGRQRGGEIARASRPTLFVEPNAIRSGLPYGLGLVGREKKQSTGPRSSSPAARRQAMQARQSAA